MTDRIYKATYKCNGCTEPCTVIVEYKKYGHIKPSCCIYEDDECCLPCWERVL